MGRKRGERREKGKKETKTRKRRIINILLCFMKIKMKCTLVVDCTKM